MLDPSKQCGDGLLLPENGRSKRNVYDSSVADQAQNTAQDGHGPLANSSATRRWPIDGQIHCYKGPFKEAAATAICFLSSNYVRHRQDAAHHRRHCRESRRDHNWAEPAPCANTKRLSDEEGMYATLLVNEALRRTFKDMDKVTDGEPLAKLPRILVPSRAMMIKPPVMHYAWPVDLGFLIEFAQERGLVEYYPRSEDSDDDSEDEGEQNGPAYRYDGTILTASATNALHRIVFDAGARIPTDTLSYRLGLHGRTKRGQSAIASFYTNYDLHRTDLPPLEEIEKLREVLRVQNEGPPKWYLDISDYKWEPWVGRW